MTLLRGVSYLIILYSSMETQNTHTTSEVPALNDLNAVNVDQI